MLNKYQTLKAECKTLGLDTTGKQEDLEKRLAEYYNSNPTVTVVDEVGNNEVIDIPKTFEQSDVINEDFISDDPPQENNFTQPELLQQVVYYADHLLVALQGIYIGGHAAQLRDQLYEVLSKYKNS